MSETTSSPEPVTNPIETTAPATPTVVETRDDDKPRRRGKLNSVAAWVGIAAGSVFIVAVVFFSGFVLGLSAGGGHHGGHHRDGGGQMHHEGGPGHGWPGGPGGFGPGGPGGFGPGFQGGGPGFPGGQSGQGGPGQGPAGVPPSQSNR